MDQKTRSTPTLWIRGSAPSGQQARGHSIHPLHSSRGSNEANMSRLSPKLPPFRQPERFPASSSQAYDHSTTYSRNSIQHPFGFFTASHYDQRLDDNHAAISNAPFRFAQHVRPGDTIHPAPDGGPAYSPISQLANNMLFQRQVGEKRNNEFSSPFLRGDNVEQGLPRSSPVTPLLNFRNYPCGPRTPAVFDSSPLPMENSSPSTRISMNRTSRPRVAARGSFHEGPSLDYSDTSDVVPAFRGGDELDPFDTHREIMDDPPPSCSKNIIPPDHLPPKAHGIQLVSPRELPDRFRQLFPYQLFNAVQSKCFNAMYRTDDNVVISAPTGSGKTVLLELAICRLVEGYDSGQFKIAYQAPTKSLCYERVKDWQKKFAHLNLPCAELTGDTEHAEMNAVRNASIIVTTPEKWDSITRKWKDYIRLLQMVKLFLIDEVHIIKDSRGATLEAVVSRMKSVGTNVRFVALSATVPNSHDIAVWLGKDHTNGHLPAHCERFGEDYRPVKLQKHVHGYDGPSNDYAFQKVLDSKLPQLITKYTQKKPIMVFCFTRKSCEGTAASLAAWWTGQKMAERAWPAPARRVAVGHKNLEDLVECGVAFHHAGLASEDRNAIEGAFLQGDISVICCTSTLAVGVNLPCHLVVLKGTVGYQDRMLCEYCDLEVMQMLGRAGRPQFDDTAIAIIMTRSEKVDRYKKMISGQEILESTLHLNLIEYLNSEIGLGTVRDVHTAKTWLSGTFLAVRMRQNPSYYKIDGACSTRDADEQLEIVCERDIKLLQENRLISNEQRFICTEYGDAMSRYMIQFETMKLILSVPPHAKTEQILHILCQAHEFRDLRMKPSERVCLREFNKSPFIKFPIEENITTTAHKISLIIQVQLGGIEYPNSKDFNLIRRQFMMETKTIFQHIRRLSKCLADCKLADCDAVSTKHALDLIRSLSAGYWEYSSLQLRQIPNIGPVAVRKLTSSNIHSVEQLANLDTAVIERIMNKNPPYGKNMRDTLAKFPRLILTSKQEEKVTPKPGELPKITVKSHLTFENTVVPNWAGRIPSVTFMAEHSSGQVVHFWRGNIKNLQNGCEISFTVELSSSEDEIKCHLACDDIVGTVCSSILKPNIPASAFPVQKPVKQQMNLSFETAKDVMNRQNNEFEFNDIEDEELLEVAKGVECPSSDYGSVDHLEEFEDIDNIISEENPTSKTQSTDVVAESVQMANGRWTCNHPCSGGAATKNGRECKHKCCHEGLDKPRKSSTAKRDEQSTVPRKNDNRYSESLKSRKQNLTSPSKSAFRSEKGQTKPNVSSQSRRIHDHATNPDSDVEVIDLAKETPSYEDQASSSLSSLHKKVQKNNDLRLSRFKQPKFPYASGELPDLSPVGGGGSRNNISDYTTDIETLSDIEDFPSPETLLRKDRTGNTKARILTESQSEEIVPSQQENDYEKDVIDLCSPISPHQDDIDYVNKDSNDVFEFNTDKPTNDPLTPPTTNSRDSHKRPRSPVSDLSPAKRPFIKPDIPLEELRHPVPEWVNEFDSDLIDELRDIVEFVE
ncbi:Sec63 Brl domain-containing protein [Xylogone sp. PMI_703]|nr:Sec63 Brl domain-containing protein [Xylogone sp. PMI_703]